MRSPLEVTYDEVANNPGICKDNPLSRIRQMDGSIILWEGHKSPTDMRSPEFRVAMAMNGTYKFFKLDKRYGKWVQIRHLEPRRFFRKKKEKAEPGTIRIELFSNNRVVRTIG